MNITTQSLLFVVLQTVHDGRIYTVKLYCDQNYPDRVSSECSVFCQNGSCILRQASRHQDLMLNFFVQPPQVRFETRVNLGCVGQNGVVSLLAVLHQLWPMKWPLFCITLFCLQQVDARHFHVLSNWNSKYTIETILVELRREMASHHNRKLQQPPEGTTY